MRFSTAGLPYIEAESTHELGLSLARNALQTPVRTEASDKAARSICWAVIEGWGRTESHARPYFLFREDFYTRNGAGKQILNGANVYRQALLDVLGNQQAPSRQPIYERTVPEPESNLPHRRWTWYGAGLLHIIGGAEMLVLEGTTQRWRTTPREGWVDYYQFGALTPIDRPETSARTFRRIDMDVYDTPDFLPTDKVHIGNLQAH